MQKLEQTKGQCIKCQDIHPKQSMFQHLKKCTLTLSEPNSFIIKVVDAHAKFYWIYVAVPLNASLIELDGFLKDLWLECCGHLSAFNIEERQYEFSPFSRSESKVRTILYPGLKFSYQYDFGSTTTLDLEVVGIYSYQNSKKITLLSRNQEPVISCSECSKKAVFIDTEYYETYCLECSNELEDEEYLCPIVNSPRTGVCGYSG